MNDNEKKTPDMGDKDLSLGVSCYQQQKYDDAFKAFMKAALKGNANAMNNVSYCFDRGLGTPVDKVASFEWLKKAAESGFSPSYFPLAVKYLTADGTKKAYEKAAEWARKANTPDNVNQENAQKMLADLEKLVKQVAAKQLQELAEEQQEIVKGLECIKEEKYEEAFQHFGEAAKQGNAAGLYNMAICYANGQGVAKDEQLAFAFMKQAAESNVEVAYFGLANQYFQGFGTEKSLEKAEKWAKKAVEAKNQYTRNAQVLLTAIQREKRVDPKLQEALKNGVQLWQEQKFEEALPDLEIAARAGHAAALRLIGIAYLTGNGVAQNPDKAYAFLEAAAFRGDQQAVGLMTQGFSGGGKIALWMKYAQDRGMEGCDQAFQANVKREQSAKNGSKAKNALQAMVQAAEIWKLSEEAPEQFDTMTGKNPALAKMVARPSLEKAMRYGNLDAVCGMAQCYEQIDDPKVKNIPIEQYRLAAYMGHSYAMYQVAQHYDSVDVKIANICYMLASHWGYEPAAAVCKERDIQNAKPR